MVMVGTRGSGRRQDSLTVVAEVVIGRAFGSAREVTSNTEALLFVCVVDGCLFELVDDGHDHDHEAGSDDHDDG